MNVIGLLVLLIVVGLIYWAIQQIAGAFGIPAPIVTIINVVLVVVVVLYLVQCIGGTSLVGMPALHLR